jgi:dTDP-4-amino-4,6-dideoxygalactose transaminase
LHASPAGARFGRSAGRLPVTESVAERLVRIPLWPGIDEDQVGAICEAVTHAARSAAEQKR